MARESSAQLTCGVIKQQLVVTATLVLFCLDSAQGIVARQLLQPCHLAEAWRVVRAVVDGAGDQRLVDVPGDKTHDHFLPDTRHELMAKAFPCAGVGDSQPRGVLRRLPCAVALIGLLALPMKAHFHSRPLIGMHLTQGTIADHDSGQRPGNHWAWRQALRAIKNMATDTGEGVAVVRFSFGQVVVMPLVLHVQQQKLINRGPWRAWIIAARCPCGVMSGMLRQRKGVARHHRSAVAGPAKGFAQRM